MGHELERAAWGKMDQPSATPAPQEARTNGRRIEVRVARGIDEMMMAFAIRSAVFLAEQSCPYGEEFDGNDATATHVIGFVDDEPAATIRIRYFGTFTKMERMAIRREYRGSPVASRMLEYVVDFAKTKGYDTIVVHTQVGRERFWRLALRRFGGFRALRPEAGTISFSEHSYQPIVLDLAQKPDTIGVDTDPHVMNRPEGEWDRPGILELGLTRMPRPSAKIRE